MNTSHYVLLLIIGLTILYRWLRPRIKGAIGEKTTSTILAIGLNRSKYKVINNVVLEAKGRTAQIDHLIVSDFGVFVIETKNFKGWILGHENAYHWTQVIYRYKNKFYNPIRQNQGHIHAIKYCLKDFPSITYIPIVVFPSKTKLKVRTTSHVTNTARLLRVIQQYKEVVLTGLEKEAIFDRLNAANKASIYSRRRHVKSIRKRVQEKEQSVKQGKCPKCGGVLIQRKGQFGYFKGCSNFPKCRFTLSD